MEDKNRSFLSNITTRVKTKFEQKSRRFVPVELEANTLTSLVAEGRLRFKEKRNKNKVPITEEMEESQASTHDNLNINEEEITITERGSERRSPRKDYDASDEEESGNEDIHKEMLGKHNSNVQQISRQLQST